MGIIWVVHHERATETVAVLCRQMAVVPEGAGLTSRGEIVQERVARGDRALVNHRRAISIVGALLEQSMPMLQKQDISGTKNSRGQSN